MKRRARENGLILVVAIAVDVLCLPVASWAEIGGTDGEPDQLEVHVRNLESTDAVARYRSVRALGELGGDDAVEALSAIVMDDPSPDIRGWGLLSLHAIGTPEALAAIRIAEAHDPDRNVRVLASELLGSSVLNGSASSAADTTVELSPQVADGERSFYSLSSADQERYVRRSRNLAISGFTLAGTGLVCISLGYALMFSGTGQNMDSGFALHLVGVASWSVDTILFIVAGVKAHRAMGRRHNRLAFACGVTMALSFALTLASLIVGVTTWDESESLISIAAINGVVGAATRAMSLVLGGQVMRNTRSLR